MCEWKLAICILIELQHTCFTTCCLAKQLVKQENVFLFLSAFLSPFSFPTILLFLPCFSLVQHHQNCLFSSVKPHFLSPLAFLLLSPLSLSHSSQFLSYATIICLSLSHTYLQMGSSQMCNVPQVRGGPFLATLCSQHRWLPAPDRVAWYPRSIEVSQHYSTVTAYDTQNVP